jgi:PPOX class probable F420-dependent enzyme
MQLAPEFEAFLAEPHIAVLGTLRKDGSPHMTAVWYVWEDGEILLTTSDRRAKYRHVLRDPRVSLAVAGTEIPYKQVVLEGKVRVRPDVDHQLYRRLSIRYYGEAEGNASSDYDRDVVKENRLILSFVPQKVMTWNFGVEDDYHKPWLPSPDFDPNLPDLG